ncbi:glutaredoxin domain-containing protein [Blastomyces dermatitidis ER-3]|uniref:Glutaredoxin domain-containing protein n=1 Tax=Ajellomyces dermatitidis (strain ER-3 / ATCC MYA-2586) TaxID=559297 RepID=A0ABP2EV88_AJEDR|nr:glutaredoxin domain-containing protein [Blastomyces dermatitidis ER-3]EEQ86855.2 glutaredoxin domain-containing protein [Blastomyces dermatitidis ER-3]
MKRSSPAFPTRHASFPTASGHRIMLPSARRSMRLLMMAVLGVVFLICYLSANATRIQNEEFYQQTVEAIDARASRRLGQMSGGGDDDENLFQKLRTTKLAPEDRQAIAVERQRYESPLKMTPPGSGGDGGDGGDGGSGVGSNEKSIAGRKKMPAVSQPASSESNHEENLEVEAELNAILKRSPVIIFSKSYCPYSHKAKSILQSKYTITPGPFVVELDMHPLGPQLQEVLGRNTGRRTVPNVLVNGMTIGGGDDIEDLDVTGQLAAKIKTLGGKRVMEMRVRDQGTSL